MSEDWPRARGMEEIEAARTPAGGWTKEQLAQWGVSWPPPRGWKKRIDRAATGGLVVKEDDRSSGAQEMALTGGAVTDDRALSLHRTAVGLHRKSLRERLTEEEVEAYLAAQRALNPLLSTETLLSYLGRGG